MVGTMVCAEGYVKRGVSATGRWGGRAEAAGGVWVPRKAFCFLVLLIFSVLFRGQTLTNEDENENENGSENENENEDGNENENENEDENDFRRGSGYLRATSIRALPWTLGCCSVRKFLKPKCSSAAMISCFSIQ